MTDESPASRIGDLLVDHPVVVTWLCTGRVAALHRYQSARAAHARLRHAARGTDDEAAPARLLFKLAAGPARSAVSAAAWPPAACSILCPPGRVAVFVSV